MKLSYNWIREYIDTRVTPEEMAGILTDIGLEVESMESYESVKGGMEGMVIAEVKSCRKHPHADKLSLAEVDAGRGRLYPVVCGAPNLAAGQKVVLALPGAKVYRGESVLEISKTTIRGETSEGMICAEDELGLGTDHTGIMVLDPGAKTGMPARDYFGIVTDTVFEVGLTPNRIDGASHYGAARDLAAYFSIREKAGLSLPPVDPFRPDSNKFHIDVRIEDPEACPRYTGLTISGIKVGDSPAWLQDRLRAIGQSPINNVVDITNYVLHETGQPLHAFDADKVAGNTVVVKKVKEGTRFVSLDGEERILSPEDLMICNSAEPMCIGGVFGGIGSGVTGETTSIFLESAYFDPLSIRRTSKRHGLNTDASFHFERGADPSMTLYALKRAALLIREMAGGEISSEIVDRYPTPVPDHTVELSFAHANRLIGEKLEPGTMVTILEALDVKILEQTGAGLKLSVPAYRVDVTREADVIEEILRIYGYNSVPLPATMTSSLSYLEKPDREKVKNEVASLLTGNGYHEIMNNSLSNASYYIDSKTFPQNLSVKLLNPLSNDLNVMRQTLLFGGLEVILYNTNRQHPDLQLFEFGHVASLKKPDAGKKDLGGYIQEEHLGIWITGEKDPPGWMRPGEKTSFFVLKSIADKVLVRLGFDHGKSEINYIYNDIYAEGLSYVCKGRILLEMGSIQASLLKKFDLKSPVFYADLRWETMLAEIKENKLSYTAVPRFPEVRRDLALVLDRQVRYSSIAEIAHQTEKKLLKRVTLFDVYEGDQIEKGKKSYAVSFFLQDTERTLTDKQIDQTMNRLLKAFEKELGARLRS